MEEQKIIKRIKYLKKRKNVLILAHYYQHDNVQDLADFVGDSYQLSLIASKANEPIILFCGVHFMGETAKILNPSKKVIIPDLDAGCSLASSCKLEDFQKFKALYPNAIVVSYINSSAAIKTVSDYVCTSANALEIINSIPFSREIIFTPDKNLGNFLIQKSGRKMILWDGTCVVHEAFSFTKILDLFLKYPRAKIVAHPESQQHVLQVAHFIGSTSKMIDYIQKNTAETFIIATEVGILHQLKKVIVNKLLIPAPIQEENSCACSECAFMKVNTLEKILDSLENEKHEIILSDELIQKAKIPLQRMIEICENKIVSHV